MIAIDLVLQNNESPERHKTVFLEKIMKKAPVRVLVVDDHESLRNSLRQTLALYAEIQQVGEAENGVDGVQRCVETHPDVVLLDIFMPEMGGIEAARVIRERCPQTSIVLWSTFLDPEILESARESGADHVLSKNISLDDLVDQIRNLGNRYNPTHFH